MASAPATTLAARRTALASSEHQNDLLARPAAWRRFDDRLADAGLAVSVSGGPDVKSAEPLNVY
jgi:hypothetical protein